MSMVIENFRGGDAAAVYRRFREQGRLAPEGASVRRELGDGRSSPLFPDHGV
jgi:hypothetical protein